MRTIKWGIISNINVLNMILKLALGLLVYGLVYIALCFLCRYLYSSSHKKLAKVLKKILTNNKMHKYLIMVVLCCIMIVEQLDLSSPNTQSGSQYIYLQTELASQKDVEILFSQKSDDNDEWKESESLLKLHVQDGFINASISQEMFNYYKDLFLKIYVNGTKTEFEGRIKSNLDISTYVPDDNIYMKEANEWKEEYGSTNNPACFYLYGKSLNDIAMMVEEMPFTVKAEVAAEAISIEEQFLEYNNRNIDDTEVINAEDISLMNGKLYLCLAGLAGAGTEEEKGYANCLLVEAYECMEQGLSQIDTQNIQYAKITYYLGLIGERILWKIDKEKDYDLFSVIGEKALKNYEYSLELIESNPDYYSKEGAMEYNMRDGISTLNQLGFF